MEGENRVASERRNERMVRWEPGGEQEGREGLKKYGRKERWKEDSG